MQPPLSWLVCNVFLRSAPAHITARFHSPLPLSSVGQTCLPPVSMTALPPPLPRLPGWKPITGSKKYKYIPLTACNRFPVYWLPAVTALGRHLTYMLLYVFICSQPYFNPRKYQKAGAAWWLHKDILQPLLFWYFLTYLARPLRESKREIPMLRLHFAIEFPFYLLCPPLCSGSLGRHRFPSVSHARKPVVFFHNCRYKLLADGIVLLLPAPSHHAIRISFTVFGRYCRQEYLPSVGIPAFQPPFCLIPNSTICKLLDALNHCIIHFRYKE